VSGAGRLKRAYPTLSSGPQDLLGVDANTRIQHLASKPLLPRTSAIKREVEHTGDVRRQFDAFFVEERYAAPSEGADEESELKDDVLTCSRLQFGLCPSFMPFVIGGEDTTA
jgi:hypothetical protein